MMMKRAGASFVYRLFFSGLLAACLLACQAASAGDSAALKSKRAVFEHERATRDVRHIADWVVDAGDNQAGDEALLPFVIIDKKDARVYVFDPKGRLRGAAPVLLGIGKGDVALPGIG